MTPLSFDASDDAEAKPNYQWINPENTCVKTHKNKNDGDYQ